MCVQRGPCPSLGPLYVYIGYKVINHMFHSLIYCGERAPARREPIQRCRRYSPIRQAADQRARARIDCMSARGWHRPAELERSTDLTGPSDPYNIFMVLDVFFCDDFIVCSTRPCFPDSEMMHMGNC